MDYALLSPEINSGRMYSGPGSTSFLAAASSWDGLATELASAAEGYRSVISCLNSEYWRGPASASMLATVVPFVDWLDATAAQAAQTANQATAAAAAFDEAHAMTVPPALIAANRTLLKLLISTNFLGQNLSAIADTEAAYAEMWAQDATTMYSYAGTSATAATLTPFTVPSETTNPEGLAAQAVGTAEAVGSADNPILLNLVYDLSSIVSNDSGVFTGLASTLLSLGNLGGTAAAATTGLADLAPALSTALSPALSAVKASSVAGPVLASVGRAGSIGSLSVPASWAAPASRPIHPLSSAGFTTLSAGEAVEHGMPGVPGMPLQGSRGGNGVVPRYGARLTVMARSPAFG